MSKAISERRLAAAVGLVALTWIPGNAQPTTPPANDQYRVDTKGTVTVVPNPPPDAPTAPAVTIGPAPRSAYSLAYYDFLYSDRYSPEVRRAMAPIYEDYFYRRDVMEATKWYNLESAFRELALAAASRPEQHNMGTRRNPMVTASNEPIKDVPPNAESEKSEAAEYFKARETLAAAEAQYGIKALDSPLQSRSVPQQPPPDPRYSVEANGTVRSPAALAQETDGDRARRWMREAAEQAATTLTRADAAAALGALSPDQQRAALSRAKTTAAIAPNPVDRELARLTEALNQRAASSAALARAALAGQQAADKAQHVNIPTEILRSMVPPGWVACECPGRHPNAGLFIDSQRWHSGSLTCDMVY